MNEAGKDLKFGPLLQNIRNIRYLSVRQFALECGISATYVSDLENNNRKPTMKVIQSISENINLSEEEHKMMMDAFAHDRLNIPVELLYWILDNNLIQSLDDLKKLDPQGTATKNLVLQLKTGKKG